MRSLHKENLLLWQVGLFRISVIGTVSMTGLLRSIWICEFAKLLLSTQLSKVNKNGVLS